MPKTRNVYKEGTKIKSMCRICLTQSNNVMFKLTDDLSKNTIEGGTYLDALEKVTFSKVDLNDHYPEGICPMCVSFLKMALEFLTQFEASQKRLKEMFKTNIATHECIKIEYNSNNDEEEYLTEEIKYDSEDPSNVELIIKDQTFNLNEVVVVENPQEEKHEYRRFIQNLGNEISATIVNNKNKQLTETQLEHSDSVFKSEKDEMDDEFVEENIEFIVESSDDDIENNKGEKESLEGEGDSNDSDSQKTSENDNQEYIEIDMFDKEAIESLIIDRSKLGDEGDAVSDTSTVQKGKNRKQKDEFLKEVRFPCEICKKVYQTRYSLKGHIRRAHTKQKEKTFTCEICGTICRTRSTFVNHKLKHFDRKFKCELCEKAYTTKAHLKVHMTTHSNARPYLCSVCGKDFNYANALSYHMRLHTGEKNYHCEYCPKRFRMINSLNRHVRTHTGEKPYKCQYCGRDFSSRGEVVCHEYIHTGYRPYHCKYCKKGFSKTHNLKIHLLSHGGPHHCQFCNKTFIEENILAMHYKISHKNMLTEEEIQEGTDEDSQDSREGFMRIELIEETSDMEYIYPVEGETVQVEENHF